MPFRLNPRTLWTLPALAALLAGFACSPPPPKTVPQPPPQGGFPFSTAAFTSVFRTQDGRSVSTRYWISTQGVLAEITDKAKVTFILLRGGEAYEWDAGSKEGKKGPASNGPRITGDPDALQVLRMLPEIFKPGRFQFEGYEEIDGVRTVRYSFRYREPRLRTNWDASIWILPDRAFPVRYVNRGSGGLYEIRNSKILIDPKLPPGLFAPPSEVRFQDLKLGTHG